MKKNPETLGRFGRRAVMDFSDALFERLQEAPLERITVQGLCDAANYPRATFYNYFADIYDLLDACWDRMYAQLSLDDYRQVPPLKRTEFLFERIYDHLATWDAVLMRIAEHNGIDGALVHSFERCLHRRAEAIMLDCPDLPRYEIPYDIVCEHYANTVLLVLRRSFLTRERLTRDEAVGAIRYLLQDI